MIFGARCSSVVILISLTITLAALPGQARGSIGGSHRSCKSKNKSNIVQKNYAAGMATTLAYSKYNVVLNHSYDVSKLKPL